MNPALLPFWLTLVALIFLLLASISTPIAHPLYFLRAEGVEFGMWGYCSSDRSCSPAHLGYSWGTGIIPWLTYALILIPIACGLTFIALLSLVPVLWGTGLRMYPTPAFSLFALLAAFVTFFAFIFQIALFATAHTRFAGAAEWGALPWLVLVATVFNLVASVHSGCGTMFRGGYSPYVTYGHTPRSRYGYGYRY